MTATTFKTEDAAREAVRQRGIEPNAVTTEEGGKGFTIQAAKNGFAVGTSPLRPGEDAQVEAAAKTKT